MANPLLTALEAQVTAGGYAVVDITTHGARTGHPRRIEIWFYRVGDRWFLTGSPGKRSWQANLLRDPRLIVHLKDGATGDLPATASIIRDDEERRRVITAVVDRLASTGRPGLAKLDAQAWVAGSPLAEVRFENE